MSAIAPEELGFIPTDAQRLERPVLRDAALQAEFERTGYVVVPLLSEDEVRRLRDGYLRAASTAEGLNPEGAYDDTYAEFSVIHSRPEFRRAAHDLILDVVVDAAADHLVGYRPLVANFVNKPAGSGVVPAHQNWSVVDESRYQSVSVWVALVDCDVANGAMLMCDGSHVPLRGRRGMWAYHQLSAIESEVIERHLTPVSVRAGDAIILDDAIVHYSPPNSTAEPRLAVQLVMLPDEADALFFQQVGADGDSLEVDVWNVEPAFFFDFWHGDGDVRHGTVVDHVRVSAPLLELHQFEQLLGLVPEDVGASNALVEPVVGHDAPAAERPAERAAGSGGSWIRRIVGRTTRR